MLELFRRNHFFNSIFLLIYVVLIRLGGLWDPTPLVSEQSGILSDVVYHFVDPQSITAYIISVILLFIQGAYINRIAGINRLTKTNSLFPGLFYIILMSLFPEYLNLTPMILANTILIIAISDLFYLYQKSQIADKIFNIGFYVSLSSLFFSSYILLVLAFFFGILLLKSFKFIERVRYIFGILIPYMILLTWVFWSGSLHDIWTTYFLNFFTLNIRNIPFHLYPIVQMVVYGLLIVISVVHFSNYATRMTMPVKKKYSALFWILFFALAGLFFQPGFTIVCITVLCMPLSFFIGNIMLGIENKLVVEIIHLVSLGFILSLQYLF